MEKDFPAYRSILSFVTECSDDFFFLFDTVEKILYIPQKLRSVFPIPGNATDSCTLDQWLRLVCEKDLPALQEDLTRMLSGAQADHDMDYRITDRAGNLRWINCRCRTYPIAEDAARWMIGRISYTLSQGTADLLTGAFDMELCKQEIAQVLNSGQDGYLFLVDVDDQKSINLKYGNAYGDEILKWVAQSLEASTGGTQRLYRMNGDCFAVNLPGWTRDDIKMCFVQLQARMHGKCTLSGGCVSYCTYKVPNADTLFQYAEASLDYAKANGKNTLWFFSAEDYERDIAALELKEDLQKSVQSCFAGFTLYYQAQVRSGTYSLHGAEALLRFTSPRRGAVSPAEFVPLLEKTRLIQPVGMWVLETALQQCRLWREKIPDFTISVNMSYVQLREIDISERVIQCLHRVGLPGDALTIELTESVQLLNYPYLNQILHRWKQYGISISMDDFGTGYSSLQRLREMEIDEIKLDRCFVSNVHQSVYNYRFLSNMIELADSNHIRTCCEGVETTEELSALENLHPTLYQGFLFSRPCPVDAFEDAYFHPESPVYQKREQQEAQYHRHMEDGNPLSPPDWSEGELAQSILDASEDIFYISDLRTDELYYLNPAGQRHFATSDYKGKKCYKVLQGRDTPCPFCASQDLNEDSFFTWEPVNTYCGQHFILKNKLLQFHGRLVRLGIAIDVAENEVLSKSTQERLNFAKEIVECTEILADNADYDSAVLSTLASMCEFYQADRAYLFEPDPNASGHWNNTYEWCLPHIAPHREKLQHVPSSVLVRLVERFQCNKSTVILNLDKQPVKDTGKWDEICLEEISGLIVVPLRRSGKLIGFVGINNPRYSVDDDSQARVLSCFLVNRICQEGIKRRIEDLLHSNYRNILSSLNVGLWMIRIPAGDEPRQMLADSQMYHVLGASEVLSPAECYQFWYTRINDGYFQYVDESMKRMIASRHIVQLEYTWKHPQLGEVIVQCSGVRVQSQDDTICLQGYHRIISNTECPTFLPELQMRDIFEYNELTQSVFFHTNRQMLSGENQHETGFPQCWIDNLLVHPHFSKDFQSAFWQVYLKPDLVLPEILLKSKSGTYEWYRLSMRHLGRERLDLNTVIVTVEPVGPERVQQLEAVRIQRFYLAMLSETIAYAEVDLESGQFKSLGGVWRSYAQDYRWQTTHFIDVLCGELSNYLPPQDLNQLRDYRSRAGWDSLFRKDELTRRLCFRCPIKGRSCWVELVIHLFHENVTQNVFALLYLRDVSSEKERALAQQNAANRDPLTGVLNRAAFEREVELHVRSSECPCCGALALLDVDNFKQINDSLGHLAGDQALKDLAHLLSAAFRQEDVIGRLGGDEFLVFVKDCTDRVTLTQRFQQLMDSLCCNHTVPLPSSIGITFIRTVDFDYTRSLKEADTALYRCKQLGKHQFCFFDSLP